MLRRDKRGTVTLYRIAERTHTCRTDTKRPFMLPMPMSASHDTLRNSSRAILSFFFFFLFFSLAFLRSGETFLDNSPRTVRLFLRRVETGESVARLRVLRIDAAQKIGGNTASRTKNWIIKRCPSVKWRGHYHKYFVSVEDTRINLLQEKEAFLYCDIFLYDLIDTFEHSSDEFWLIWNLLWYWDGD